MFTFHWLVQPYHEGSIITDESLENNFGKLSRSDGIVEERLNSPLPPSWQLIGSKFSKFTPWMNQSDEETFGTLYLLSCDSLRYR